MPGLFGRLIGGGSKREAERPQFTLELPEGWAGGHGHVAYMKALLAYGRAHPECRDQAMDLLGYPGDALYAAAAPCGPGANMTVSTVEVPASLPLDAALDGSVESQIENLASRSDLIGDPTSATIDTPYTGRVLRWSWSYEGARPSSFALYTFGFAGRLWDLTFGCDAVAAEVNEATFLAIASSFRVMLPAPDR